MAIDFSNTDFEPEALDEPLVTTSLTRGGRGGVLPPAQDPAGVHRPGEGQGQSGGVHPGGQNAP